MEKQIAESERALSEDGAKMRDMLAIGMISLALGVAFCITPLFTGGGSATVGTNDQSAMIADSLDISDASGGIAATVNDVTIGEKAITAYIQNFRFVNGLETDEAWGTWLAENGYSAESLRFETIDYYVNQELIRQAAAKNGVSVTVADVDERIAEARSAYEDDDEWRQGLLRSGLSEESYRRSFEVGMLQKKLSELAAHETEADDDEVLASVQAYAEYYAGAKRSSHILFSADDEDAAQDVYERLQAGELSFEAAVVEFSIDDVTKGVGGDIGFDKLTTVSNQYDRALAELNVGDISEPFSDEAGIHIVYCTEVLDVTGEITSLDQVTPGFVEVVRAQVNASSEQRAFSEFMSEFKSKSHIEKTAMGDGLPYDIDLTPYVDALYGRNSSSNSAEAETNSDESTENDGDTSATESAETTGKEGV